MADSDEPFAGRLPVRAIKILGEDPLQFADINQDGRGLIVSSNELNKIRRGERYSVTRRFTGIANGGTVDILIVTDNLKVPHVRIGISAGGDCLVDLYENTTTSNDGTAIPVVNRSRLYNESQFETSYFHAPHC